MINCKKNFKNDELEPDPIMPIEGAKNVKVNIKLPEDSKIKLEDLTVNSIISESQANDSLLVLDSDGLELIFATNKEGNIVLMNFINTSKSNNEELSATTTAKSLNILQPWLINVSSEVKEVLMNELTTKTEFTNLVKHIEKEISNGSINPLVDASTFDLLNIVQKGMFGDFNIEKTLIQLEYKDDKLKLYNKSSLAYDIYISDENGNNIDSSLISGINADILSTGFLKSVISGKLEFEKQKTEIKTPTKSGQYKISLNNSFDCYTSSKKCGKSQMLNT